MSDLQLGLVIIGVLVVVGVYLFNRLQERQFRRRMENAFQQRPEDILVATADEQPAQQEERIEPHLGAPAEATLAPAPEDDPVVEDEPPPPPRTTGEPPAAASASAATPSSTSSSPIDYVCRLESVTPMAAAALVELSKSLHAIGKPVSLKAWNAETDEWVTLPSNAVTAVTRLEAALQLADRNGPVNRVQLSTMRDLVGEFAEQVEARCRCPEIDDAAQAAAELDRFCAQVDISIGCNVVPAAAGGFPGTKLRGLLESAGFVLDPGGRFVLRADDGSPLMAAEDIEGRVLSLEHLRTATLAGLVLTLDVPRVPGHGRSFDRMLDIGRQLAQALGGTVVDDNRAPLTEAGLKVVRQRLRELHEAMQAQGIPPGSPLAERLFS